MVAELQHKEKVKLVEVQGARGKNVNFSRFYPEAVEGLSFPGWRELLI